MTEDQIPRADREGIEDAVEDAVEDALEDARYRSLHHDRNERRRPGRRLPLAVITVGEAKISCRHTDRPGPTAFEYRVRARGNADWEDPPVHADVGDGIRSEGFARLIARVHEL